jgi:hypothetical protein
LANADSDIASSWIYRMRGLCRRPQSQLPVLAPSLRNRNVAVADPIDMTFYTVTLDKGTDAFRRAGVNTLPSSARQRRRAPSSGTFDRQK